ncbi:MAG: hypothetical protein ACOYON_11855 [Fimbriimonas sp.]
MALSLAALPLFNNSVSIVELSFGKQTGQFLTKSLSSDKLAEECQLKGYSLGLIAKDTYLVVDAVGSSFARKEAVMTLIALAATQDGTANIVRVQDLPGPARAYLADELGVYGVKLDTKDRGNALAIYLQPRTRMVLGDRNLLHSFDYLPQCDPAILRAAPVLSGMDLTLGKAPSPPGTDSSIQFGAREFPTTASKWAAYNLATRAIEERIRLADKNLKAAFGGWLARNETIIRKELKVDPREPDLEDLQARLSAQVTEELLPSLGSMGFKSEADLRNFVSKSKWGKLEWILHVVWAQPGESAGKPSTLSGVTLNVVLGG